MVRDGYHIIYRGRNSPGSVRLQLAPDTDGPTTIASEIPPAVIPVASDMLNNTEWVCGSSNVVVKDP